MRGNAIDRRIASGRLLLERPGVYALPGAGGGNRARCAAALLDAGPGSLVSHFSSAAEWRIRLPAPLVVDITNPRRLNSRDGIRLHHRQIDPAEIRRLDGIPLTSPCQTLFDMASMLGTDLLAKAANEAFVQQLVTIESLRATLSRNAGRNGAAAFPISSPGSTPTATESAPRSRSASTTSSAHAASRPGSRTPACASATSGSSPTSSGVPSG